ncbi:MAG: sodium-dependent transporter [Bacteroidota bacterium]
MEKTVQTEAWGSRIGLILAMAGNAVGFGNFLRFPVQAINNGGGAFIIPYLVSFLLLGIPLLLIEWATGRFGGTLGHHSTPFILDKMDKKKMWKYVGVFGVFSNLAIAAYYCYLESWTLSYIYHSVIGTFEGMSQMDVSSFFDSYLDVSHSTTGIPYEAIVFYLLCLALNVWILSRGLSGGVEKAAKIGMPLLIVFGIFLAIKGTMIKAGAQNAINDGMVGLSFLWTPNYSSLTDPKVWFAAAGQIFFTLSVGMGTIQCYASYVKKDEDIALNAMSAGFMNEFVEIVLGGTIITSIAIGYLGIDKVVDLVQMGGLGLGFRTMPFLFQQWGDVMAIFAGVAFFGLLFFAGITSSLAMGTPVMGFFQDEYRWSRGKAASAFGILILILGLPTVLFFDKGVFDEYDYWGGTVALFTFAMLETILFSWFFGLKKGWKEINHAADIKIPNIYKFIMKYVTPILLIIIFFGALVGPKDNDWSKVGFSGWSLDKESVIGKIIHKDIGPNSSYFSDTFFTENNGVVANIELKNDKKYLIINDTINGKASSKSYEVNSDYQILVNQGQNVKVGDPIFKGSVVNNILYIDLSRLLLLLTFLAFCLLVFYAAKKHKIKG